MPFTCRLKLYTENTDASQIWSVVEKYAASISGHVAALSADIVSQAETLLLDMKSKLSGINTVLLDDYNPPRLLSNGDGSGIELLASNSKITSKVKSLKYKLYNMNVVF